MKGKGAYDYRWYETPARALKLQLQLAEVRDASKLGAAIDSMAKSGAMALAVITGSLFNVHKKQIADLAKKSRLPSMYERDDYVEAGGLMSYSASENNSLRRAAVYTDRILKGANPAEMPVEQPTEIELVANLKTAKEIGLTIPPNVLARADRVIR